MILLDAEDLQTLYDFVQSLVNDKSGDIQITMEAQQILDEINNKQFLDN